MTELVLQQLINGLVTGMAYSLLAVGFNLVFGTINIINFSHGAFYVLGGLFCYVLVSSMGLPYLVALLLSALVIGLVGFVAEKTILRPLRDKDPLVMMLATLGAGVGLESLAQALWGATPRTIPGPMSAMVQIGPVFITWQKLFIIAVGVVSIGVLHFVIRRTTLGQSMRAVAQSPTGAAVVGINFEWVYGVTVLLGAGFAGLTGGLLGAATAIYAFNALPVLIKSFVVVILGGLGSLPGAVVGGVLLGLVESLSITFLPDAFKDVIGYGVIIVVLLFRPQGLMGVSKSR